MTVSCPSFGGIGTSGTFFGLSLPVAVTTMSRMASVVMRWSTDAALRYGQGSDLGVTIGVIIVTVGEVA